MGCGSSSSKNLPFTKGERVEARCPPSPYAYGTVKKVIPPRDPDGACTVRVAFDDGRVDTCPARFVRSLADAKALHAAEAANRPRKMSDMTARHDSAEHFSRLDALLSQRWPG